MPDTIYAWLSGDRSHLPGVKMFLPWKDEVMDRMNHFFVVSTAGGRNYEVMSSEEVEATPSAQLVSGACNTRAEAEQLLKKGLTDGDFTPRTQRRA